MSRRNSRANRKSNRNAKGLPAPVPKPAPALSSKSPSRTFTNVSLTHTSEETFHSPLPPPSYLRQYDEIAPGTAKAIIEAGVKQTNHRIEMESLVIPSQTRRADRGLNYGFILGALGIVAGVVIAIFGKTDAAIITGGVLSGGTLVGLVGVFVYGSNSQRHERVQKVKDNP